MTAHEDRDWERMLEEVDLASSDEEMAAAEQRLRDLSDVDVVPVRKEWIEATVQRAIDSAKPVVPVKPTWWRKVQGFAAAAAALIGFQSVAAASFTVGAVVVTGVVAYSLWPSRSDSWATMPFELAIQVLQDPEADNEDRRAAMAEIFDRLAEGGSTLVSLEQGSHGETVASAARACVSRLRDGLSGVFAGPTQALPTGHFDARWQAASNGSVVDIEAMTDFALHALRAIHAVNEPELERPRAKLLASLRRQTGL